MAGNIGPRLGSQTPRCCPNTVANVIPDGLSSQESQRYLHLGRIPLVLCASTFLICKTGISVNCRRLVTGFPGGASGKVLDCPCRRLIRLWFYPWVGKIPWRRAQQTTPIVRAWRATVHSVTKSPTRLSTQTDGHKIRPHKWQLIQGTKQK